MTSFTWLAISRVGTKTRPWGFLVLESGMVLLKILQNFLVCTDDANESLDMESLAENVLVYLIS